MYAKAKVGGFLHLAIGEEATIVGAARALRDDGLPHLDLPLARPRARARHAARGGHGRALRPRRRRAAGGRGGSMHMFDLRAALHGRLRDRRRQPADRGRVRPRRDYSRHGGRDALHVRRRRLEPGHVRRDDEPRRAVEAARRLHGHEQPVRHGHGARAPLGRRPTCTGKGEGFGVPGMRCDGMDVLDTHDVTREALARRARGAPAASSSRRSRTASAATRWPTPRSTARRSRSRSGASATRSRPSRDAPRGRGVLTRTSARALDAEAVARVDEARRVRRRVALPAARVALRRRLRARRPGPRLVLASTSARPACTAARTSATGPSATPRRRSTHAPRARSRGRRDPRQISGAVDGPEDR